MTVHDVPAGSGCHSRPQGNTLGRGGLGPENRKARDIITEYDGREVERASGLPRAVAGTPSVATCGSGSLYLTVTV